MKIKKKESKTKSVSTKITQSQFDELEKLRIKLDITKSNLISQLLEIGFKTTTKRKTF